LSIAPGTRLGAYEVLSAIAAGGMGEVYRARDTRLDRIVALKVLPQLLATDPLFRERFDREARTISQLDHPHICALYDVGEQDGMSFLVMQYLEGETLETRLKNGALPLEQALQYAIQIATALDKAHGSGIVHRDLKPGNIMLSKGGAKLLDFGLAKTTGPIGAAAGLSMLPTTPAGLTARGTILGTFQYMAPEQLEGQDADARGDIWAFGCVLYEMLTGRPAFAGKTSASLIGSILKDEPRPITELVPVAPPTLEYVVRTCLSKDLEDRFQSVRDIWLQLTWIAGAAAGGPHDKSPSPIVRGRERIAWSVAAGALLLAAVVGGLAVLGGRTEQRAHDTPMRFTVTLPPGDQIAALDRVPAIALAPDGSKLAYVASRGDRRQLFIKTIDRLQPTALLGTEDAENPFFSPDGQWIGFFAAGELKKVSVNGGSPIVLAPARLDFGASWLSNDAILFANAFQSGLLQVPAGGGAVKTLTTVDRNAGEAGHQWPEVLPGGKAILFYLTKQTARSFDEGDIVALSLKTGDRHVVVVGGTSPHFVSTGHLLYLRGGTLFAVPFDADSLQVRGSAVPVIEGVAQSGLGVAHFAVSHEGTLAYLPRDRYLPNPVWMTRTGDKQRLSLPFGLYTQPRVSTEGTHVLFRTYGVNCDLWVYDDVRTTLTRITLSGDNHNPVWSPDGRRIAFDLAVEGRPDTRATFLMNTDGTGVPERLTMSSHSQTPQFWSRHQETLLFLDTDLSTSGQDIWWVPLAVDRTPRPFLRSPFRKAGPALSPDGRWIAYSSNESGLDQVYVQPFPAGGAKSQVSTDGGREPAWNDNGRELFYRNGDSLISVDVRTNPAFVAGQPRVLLRGQNQVSSYAVAPGGQRFLFVEQDSAPGTPAQLNVIFNWLEELKQRVPTK
jgi:serine/threonine-protein kinase